MHRAATNTHPISRFDVIDMRDQVVHAMHDAFAYKVVLEDIGQLLQSRLGNRNGNGNNVIVCVLEQAR